MVSQEIADAMTALAKLLRNSGTVVFPRVGEFLSLEADGVEPKEPFLIDINRRLAFKPTKCSYQLRYQCSSILLRLDIDGPDHDNPDGEIVPCPHLHIYRDGYNDKWAYPLTVAGLSAANVADLEATLKDFLRHCNVRKIPEVQRVAQ